MAKCRIIIADTDEEYVFPIEMKFIEELKNDIELEVITSEKYFAEYFRSPKKAEILIISEELYSKSLTQHNINNIFILSENNNCIDEGNPDNVHKIYKFTSLKHIYNQVMFSVSGELSNSKISEKETEVIMVYSAIGGSGKTSTALGLAACLTQNFKKVLFVDAEYIQNSHYFYKNRSTIPAEALRQIQLPETNVYNYLKANIRNERFDYLPPFRASLAALNLDYMFFIDFISEAKATKKYDYIVVDTDCIFDEGKNSLIDIAGHVILLMMQDEYSVMKTNILLNSMSVTDGEKMMYVCSKYRAGMKNAVLMQKSRYIVNNYIEWQEHEKMLEIDDLIQIEGMQKLTFELL